MLKFIVKGLWVLLVIGTSCLQAQDKDTAKQSPSYEYRYEGTVTIDPLSGKMDAAWVITPTGPDIEKVTFALNGAFTDIAVSGKGLATYTINFEPEADGRRLMTLVMLPGSQDSFSISYRGVPFATPMASKVNHIGADYIELTKESYWFPLDITKEPLIAARLTLDLGTYWEAISTGPVVHQGSVVLIDNSFLPMADIPVTMAPSFTRIDGSGFTIFDLRRMPLKLKALNKAVTGCYTYLNQHFGQQKPLPHGYFILQDRPKGGYARQHYIVLSSIKDMSQEKLMGYICRELTGHWRGSPMGGGAGRTGGVVGDDAWMGDAFAVTIEVMAVRAELGEKKAKAILTAFEEEVFDKRLPAVWSSKEVAPLSPLVASRKAPILLFALEQKMGRKKFAALLQGYMRGAIRTTPQLLAFVSKEARQSVAAWLETALMKKGDGLPNG